MIAMDKVELLPNVKLTPTQQRIFDLLSDGQRHTPEEAMQVIDSQADRNTLSAHLANLRNAIYSSGYLIAGHALGYKGITHYQLVQRLRISMD